MERKTLFVDVLLPLPVKGLFTYRVPYELNDSIIKGQRVVVQFGKKKIYTAIVVNIHDQVPKEHTIKYILSILDIYPIVNNLQLVFWKWMSGYYLCEEGEVMNTALPSSLKLASETQIKLHPEFDIQNAILGEKELLIYEALFHNEKLSITEVSDISGQLKIFPLINTMLENGVIQTEEELLNTYRPRKETIVSLSPEYAQDEDKLRETFDSLSKRAFKQLEILMTYIHLIQQKPHDITRPELLKHAKATSTQLNSLIDKGIFRISEKEVSRLEDHDSSKPVGSIQFTGAQQIALDEINGAFRDHNTILLHGVTSSGKTEIYIRLIQDVINRGKQVLFLLPEIALTTQIINRLRRYFGNQVGVYHSRYSKNEKVEIWNRVLIQEEDQLQYKIIIGPRSALFLPYKNLGLVIVDEEHDHSFKQFDPAPRYNARDCAIYLAGLHGAKTILGSATPSIESYYNAKQDKYGLVELTERYGGIKMPEVVIADIRKESRYKTMKSHFSSLLLEHIKNALKQGKQVILFQNRRGFSLRLECNTCGYIPQCKNCDVTLIYHKRENHLRCHYCGWTTRIPDRCPACGNPGILMQGFGTEKIEDDLAILFPEPRIARMDLDTTRKKHAYQQIISDFEEKKIDILVGTQMVTKGLDFDNVSLVGILNADNMLSYPDFRSMERSFQLMAQVSGRAGRKGKQGKVIIQTFNPNHYIIRDVINNDYQSMYNSQVIERRNFKYPPFQRLILIKLKHRESQLLNQGARVLAEILREKFSKRILGPEYPIVSRIKNQYIKQILVKIEKEISLSKSKLELLKCIDGFQRLKDFKTVRVIIDVDPM